MGPTDLVLHDWMNMTAAEQATAIADVRALAKTFGVPSANASDANGRRARALNIVATFFSFISPGAAENTKGR